MSRLFLGNLPPDVAPREIEDRFRDFGKIVDIVIKPNFGFVEFRDERDAREAMDRMNNRDFMGKR
ncbi:hypothetical protein EV182_000853 [Spiromyces aspiralis]|uniref:Uncharacterized protein n=1 Tax=Spiromyces aspiralis TaxID=68401 RepID=A0ACC1HGB4_9FUNG|nr:hypothetical protein EV182_000853 [Spiromyces aspiralis]